MIWNPRAEAQSPGDRAALQLARLKETLAWAIGRVPFYWERLGAARVERLDDLARLPFTRKSDLREHYPFGLFAVPREEIVRIHASSGTRASRRWSPTRPATWRSGARSWRARSWPLAAAVAICCRTPSGTGSSRAASASTRRPS